MLTQLAITVIRTRFPCHDFFMLVIMHNSALLLPSVCPVCAQCVPSPCPVSAIVGTVQLACPPVPYCNDAVYPSQWFSFTRPITQSVLRNNNKQSSGPIIWVRMMRFYKSPWGMGHSRRYCNTGPTRGKGGASP